MLKKAGFSALFVLCFGCDPDECGPPGSALDCSVPSEFGAINVVYAFDGGGDCQALGIEELQVDVDNNDAGESQTLEFVCDDGDIDLPGLAVGATRVELRALGAEGHQWSGFVSGALVAEGETIPVDIVLANESVEPIDPEGVE